MNKSVQLELAREKLKRIGKSPNELGKLHRLMTYDLIYKWGCTSPSIIQAFLGITKGGYLQKLTDQGFLKKTKTESGKPKYIYTLTRAGLEEAERHSMVLLPYPEIDPYRANQQLLRHNLLVQSATVNALVLGGIDEYESERMVSICGDKPGEKRVDACWIKSGIRTGIEFELTKKWERKLDEFVYQIIIALQNKKYDQFIIFSDAQAIISGYSAAMKTGALINIWRKNIKGAWIVDRTETVPAWLSDKISFQLIES